MSEANDEQVAAQYSILRSTVGILPPRGDLCLLRGAARSELLRVTLARNTEYVEPLTTIDSIVLTGDGTVWDVVTYVELDDSAWLLSASVRGLAELLRERASAAGIEQVDIDDQTAQHDVVAFEGPAAWRLAQSLVDFDISSLVLNSAITVSLPGDPAEAILVRTGTTGEYGYLLIAPLDANPRALLTDRACELSGGTVGARALARAQAEVRHPLLPEQADGLNVREAGLEWLVSLNREDEFTGRSSIDLGPLERAAIAVTAPAGSQLVAGAPITAAEQQVGNIKVTAERAGLDAELAIAVLRRPFAVPGLGLATLAASGTSVDIQTVSSPCVVPRSWTERMGG